MKLVRLNESRPKRTKEEEAEALRIMKKDAKKLNMRRDKDSDWLLPIETPKHEKLLFCIDHWRFVTIYRVEKDGCRGSVHTNWQWYWNRLLETTTSYDYHEEYSIYSLETLEAIPKVFNEMVRIYKLKVGTWTSPWLESQYQN